jgi:hypothetical protein
VGSAANHPSVAYSIDDYHASSSPIVSAVRQASPNSAACSFAANLTGADALPTESAASEVPPSAHPHLIQRSDTKYVAQQSGVVLGCYRIFHPS